MGTQGGGCGEGEKIPVTETPWNPETTNSREASGAGSGSRAGRAGGEGVGFYPVGKVVIRGT